MGGADAYFYLLAGSEEGLLKEQVWWAGVCVHVCFR